MDYKWALVQIKISLISSVYRVTYNPLQNVIRYLTWQSLGPMTQNDYETGKEARPVVFKTTVNLK